MKIDSINFLGIFCIIFEIALGEYVKQDNYISFSIVVGFFVGLVFSIIKFQSPELIILFTIIFSIILYLIALFCASMYMKFIDYDEKKMNIKKLDSTLNYYLDEFDKKEKETTSIRNYLKHNINSMNNKEV